MIKTREDLRTYLAADLKAHGLDRWKLRYQLLERPAYFQRMLRKSEYWTNTAHTPLGHAIAFWLRLRTKLLGERLGLYVPRNVCGPGLRLAHPGGLWIHHNARIGANCNIHHGVSIGENRGKVPVIGDDVWIYPMAMVLGDVHVGDRASIMAGAVVTKPVPNDAVVAGAPARIITVDSRSTAVANA
ncbi:serine acetyltransferase [Mycobacterium sp. 1554424.7]|nr:serine acetyltransferase [Mycobacterium sp. 1554424.7]